MKQELLVEHRLKLIERRPKRAVLNEYYAASRAEAKARGLKYYFTGKPCRRGHLVKRHVRYGHCRECQRILEKVRGVKRELLNGHRVQLESAVLIERRVIDRAEAKARGLIRYYTGRPCQLGHLAERYVRDCKCAACKRLAYEKRRLANPMWEAFQEHRHNAKFRDIDFLFTYEEWRDWWLTDDRWSRRGCKRDQLVMARFGDEGPYSLDNVYCATVVQNLAEAKAKRSAAQLDAKPKPRLKLRRSRRIRRSTASPSLF